MSYYRIARISLGRVVVVMVLLSVMTASLQAAWEQQFKLLASDGETGDTFGIWVAINANTGIVGAYMDDNEGLVDCGAAYLFDATTGQQISKLTASDAGNYDYFGFPVAISGSTVIVGASGDDGFTGSAYVFDVSDPYNPLETYKLVASDRASYDFFGHHGIAISGSIAIIGAHADDDGGDMSGSAYLFDITSGKQIAKLTASDAAPRAYFGISCAISGSTAIVGASQGNQGCPSCPIPPGVAYLFDISDPYYPVETCKFTASDPQNDDFGFSVAIAGNAALVGADYHDGDGLTDCGAAYLFDVTDIYNPVLVRKLIPADPEADSRFGHMVAMNADTAVVGAVWGHTAGLVDRGSVYLFDVTTGEQLGKLTASDGADYDQFGYSVAIEGETLVVGANLDDDSGSNSGSAYVFKNICNALPVADAGEDQTVYADADFTADVTLDGSESDDPDGDELSYLWTWTIGGEARQATGVNPVIELPVGEHTVELIVNDGQEDSEPDQVVITVIAPMKASLSVLPRVINRYSSIPHIMAMVRLFGISKDQVDCETPLLLYPGGIKATSQRVSECGRGGTHATMIIARFDKSALMDAARDNGSVELTGVGRLKSGQYFCGTDTIRIIAPGPRR
jgi:hypothetical protein